MDAVCATCTTPYAPSLAACPHCGSTSRKQEDDTMPSISRHGGVTDARDLVDDPDGEQLVEDQRDLDPTRIVHGEVQPARRDDEETVPVDEAGRDADAQAEHEPHDAHELGAGEQVEVHGPDGATVDRGPDADQLPKPSASKADWVAAAVRLGWSQEDAEARTRDQLAEELTR